MKYFVKKVLQTYKINYLFSEKVSTDNARISCIAPKKHVLRLAIFDEYSVLALLLWNYSKVHELVFHLLSISLQSVEVAEIGLYL